MNKTYRPCPAGSIDRTDPFALSDRLMLLRRQANLEQRQADAQTGATPGLLHDLDLCAALASQNEMEKRLSALIADDPILRGWASSAGAAHPTTCPPTHPTTHHPEQPSAARTKKRRAWAAQDGEVVDVDWRELPSDADPDPPGGGPGPA